MHQEFTELLGLLQYIRREPSQAPKALCTIALVSAELAERIQPLISLDTHNYTFAIDSYGLRHALTGHSQERGGREHFSLLEADILALPSWLGQPAVIRASKQPKHDLQPRRVRFEQPEFFSLVKTVVILEVRTGRKQLVLVTMYKTENG